MSAGTPCYICETRMDEIRLDPHDLKPRPCSECEQIIEESLQEFGDPDVPNIEDEDFDELEISDYDDFQLMSRDEDEL